MEPQKVSYYNEVCMMMFGFGDSHKPNPDTVRLVETIVLSQMRMIVQEAMKYVSGNTLEAEQLVFLMRKNKFKVRRFIKYLQMKELKKAAENLHSVTVDLTEPRKNELIEFIEKLDETGELTNVNEFDEVKYERQLRADRMSLALDEEKYMKFYKARCASFNSKQMSQPRNFQKLRNWIDPKEEIKFTHAAMDVLSYYAYETVAQLMDYALLVRMDMKSTSDPLSNIASSSYNATMFNGEYRQTGNNPDYSKVYSGQPAISVAEIKEVMRRVYAPQTGKLMLGKQKLPDTAYILAL